MIIKQGTILPTTGIGVGYLLLLIYGILLWNFGIKEVLLMPKTYCLLIIFALMQFSYKDFIIHDYEPEYYRIRYRILFFIRFNVKHSFDNYSPYVLRVINKSFNVMQSGTHGMTTGQFNEKYFAIVGRNKKSKNVIEICKGSKDELNTIIKLYIQTKNIPVYLGAQKKGYEYRI
jgi:hypothetical protein